MGNQAEALPVLGVDLMSELGDLIYDPPDLVDIAVWPCGVWCFLDEVEDMLIFMSDDFEVKEVLMSDLE